ncbi:hypothetical protein KIW84_072220 [Lathyrus oleraceus]|uniref:Uncharacterized protein n=1 Tax=Pisum sativum TaxID=3888 RepID=A0A9D4ZX48_PEA|nr:hypothetical protein KIW84_072220 [Pisum sativum]
MKKFGSQKERVKYCVRPLNNDQDVLQFLKDIVGYDVIDVYVEHSVGIPHIIDDSELNVEDDVQCIGLKRNTDPNGVVEDGVTTDPNGGGAKEENIDPNGVAENDVSIVPNGVAEEENIDPNDDVTIDPNVIAGEGTTDIDEDYVATEGEASSCQNKKDHAEMVHVESEDSDHLYTPPGSDDEDEGMKDVVKDYAMENQKNVFIKKNDSKMIVVKCTDGYHTCHRIADNRSEKTKWLANRFARILRHNPFMKPSGLKAEVVERWGVKLSHDQTYRAKRKSMELVQGVGIEQFTHLRSYGQELLKSNSNSTVVIQYTDSNGNHVFERIYLCLETCNEGFAKTSRPLIRKSTFMDTYSSIVYPTNGLQLKLVDDLNTMAPPVMGRAIGRPKN